MILLGIETATQVCGVGIVNDDEVIADFRIFKDMLHAEVLAQVVKEMFQISRISMSDIDGIAVSIGPGSFTGLRIGLAFAKGLSCGLDRPLVAVPTMDGIVCNVPHISEWACVVMRAREGEYYRGLYRWSEDEWRREGEYIIVKESCIDEGIDVEDIIFIGECESCSQKSRDGKRFILMPNRISTGWAIAMRGSVLLKSGELSDPDTVTPLYIQRFLGIA